jgi:hypothetical protein
MIAPHLLGGADEDSASPETIKKAAGPPATPQESNNSRESSEKPCAWLPAPEPWGEPVDGEELLNEIRDVFNRHVVLPDHAAVTLALWVMHTYSCQLGRVSSYIGLLSPVPECGKSTAATIVYQFCNKGCITANITGAGIFRIIDKHSPTLLIDEVDTFISGNDQLRGILNAGYTRETAFVHRCVGDDHEIQSFNVFGPKLFGNIGKLPDTLESRCIIIPMRRKMKSEHVEELLDSFDGSDVRRKCMRWTIDHQIEIKHANPEMPKEIYNRDAQIWRPLLAIADLVGGEWPMLAHLAAVALNGGKEDEESINIELLKDIRDYVQEHNSAEVKTRELLHHLYTLEERPWNTFYRGREMTARQLANRMRSFGIRSTTIRFGNETAKGYLLEDMVDAFNRYTYAEQP